MEPRRSAATFATTHWSVVLAAGDTSPEDRERALDALCRVASQSFDAGDVGHMLLGFILGDLPPKFNFEFSR